MEVRKNARTPADMIGNLSPRWSPDVAPNRAIGVSLRSCRVRRSADAPRRPPAPASLGCASSLGCACSPPRCLIARSRRGTLGHWLSAGRGVAAHPVAHEPQAGEGSSVIRRWPGSWRARTRLQVSGWYGIRAASTMVTRQTASLILAPPSARSQPDGPSEPGAGIPRRGDRPVQRRCWPGCRVRLGFLVIEVCPADPDWASLH
jgi:hypothetical protein